MTLKRFVEFHIELVTGKISVAHYMGKIRFKIRDTLYSLPLYRRLSRRLFPLRLVSVTRMTRDELTNSQKQVRCGANHTSGHMHKTSGEDKLRPSSESDSDYYAYAARYKGEIIGKIRMSSNSKINDLCGSKLFIISGTHVEPQFRGFGVGYALHKELLRAARNNKIDTIYQTINRSNRRNLELAKKLGLRRVDEDLEKRLIGNTRMYALYITLNEGNRA